MNEFLSRGQDITHNKYNRLVVITFFDTLLNLPILVVRLVLPAVQHPGSSLNYPYVSWKNVHDGAGGYFPGSSLSSILQIPTNEWGSLSIISNVKWIEWSYVLYAAVLFSVFGTTPEMRQHYRSAIWFLPERCGYKRQRVFEVETVSDVAFNSNLGQQVGNRSPANT